MWCFPYKTYRTNKYIKLQSNIQLAIAKMSECIKTHLAKINTPGTKGRFYQCTSMV